MNITIRKIFRLQILFRGGSYEHHLAKRNTTDSVILIIEDTDGVQGVGECCPRIYVTMETHQTVMDGVQLMAERVFSLFDGSIDSIHSALAIIPDNNPSTRCLFESALITYLCRKSKTNPFNRLNISPISSIVYTAAFDSGDENVFAQMLQFYTKMQMQRAKLKVNASNDVNLKRIEVIRQHLGEAIPIRMDGNAIWSWKDHHGSITKLVDHGINCFEQLFDTDDLESCKQFRNYFGDKVELIADESVTTLSSGKFHAIEDYYSGVNLKISKNGGLFRCLEIAKLFQLQGKSVRLGCHVGETSLLTLWGLLFNASFPTIKDVEGAFGSFLLEKDPFEPTIIFGKYGKIDIDKEWIQKISNFQLSEGEN